MSIKITKVDLKDTHIIKAIIDNLLELENEKPSSAHLEKMLSDDRTYLLAAILEDQVIGFALAYQFPSLYASNYLAYLYDIGVLEAHRRKGAGRLLVETLLQLLGAQEVSELWLGTGTDNIEGQALFGKTGGIKSDETFNDFTYYLS